MAWEHDADRIDTVGPAECPSRGGHAERRRLPAITRGAAKRNLPERVPCSELEARTVKVERDVERRSLTSEVFIQLGGGLLQDRMIRLAPMTSGAGQLGRRPRPEDGSKTGIRRDQGELADRRRVRAAKELSC